MSSQVGKLRPKGRRARRGHLRVGSRAGFRRHPRGPPQVLAWALDAFHVPCLPVTNQEASVQGLGTCPGLSAVRGPGPPSRGLAVSTGVADQTRPRGRGRKGGRRCSGDPGQAVAGKASSELGTGGGAGGQEEGSNRGRSGTTQPPRPHPPQTPPMPAGPQEGFTHHRLLRAASCWLQEREKAGQSGRGWRGRLWGAWGGRCPLGLPSRGTGSPLRLAEKGEAKGGTSSPTEAWWAWGLGGEGGPWSRQRPARSPSRQPHVGSRVVGDLRPRVSVHSLSLGPPHGLLRTREGLGLGQSWGTNRPPWSLPWGLAGCTGPRPEAVAWAGGLGGST